jgi:hypothetical protein
MGSRYNDNIVYVLVMICKFVIVIGGLTGITICFTPDDEGQREVALGLIFIVLVVSNIFIWIARDPTVTE